MIIKKNGTNRNCNIYAIELLLKHGADLTVRDIYNRSIMHWAAYTGKVCVFLYFIDFDQQSLLIFQQQKTTVRWSTIFRRTTE